MRPNDLFSANTDLSSLAQKLIFTRAEDARDIQLACQQASKHRLAVPGWTFFEIFRAGAAADASEYKIDRVSMCFSGLTGLPVGCAVLFDAWGDLNAGCFVRSCHRRMKIGSRLVTELLRDESRAVRIHDGIKGSKDFWAVMGANNMDYIKESSAPH